MAYPVSTPVFQTRRQRYELLRSQLETERSSFLGHWRLLADYILPRRPKFNRTDRNRGDRRTDQIIDSTATLAARTLKSGMMSGITSPSRPWFRLSLQDKAAMDSNAVRRWLDDVTGKMSEVFLQTNLYNALPIVYGDMGVFGTGAIVVEEDFEDVMNFYPLPIGSYMIANDEKMRVRVFFREMSLTVRQLIQKFGERDQKGEIIWDNFSANVQHLYNLGQLETWVDLCHVIVPNEEYDENRIESRFKKYSSVYYEKGYNDSGSTRNIQTPSDDTFLKISGFDYFPVLAPRWEVKAEDSWSTDCPGMEALPDIKALQLIEKRVLQAIEKQVNPPMTGPTSMRNAEISILPGAMNLADVREGMQGFRPAHEVTLSIADAENKMIQLRQRISRAFFEDLFLMLQQSDRRNITAREVQERHEEKLTALGSVLEQLNKDLLKPLIDIAFQVMFNQGLIPEPPEELAEYEGMELKVEYISIMAQAQKLMGVNSVERFAGFIGQVVQVTQDPSALDKIDIDETIDSYGDMTGVPQSIIRSTDDANKIRQARAEAQAEQAQAAQMREAASGAKDLAGAKMDEDNALTRLMGQAQAGAVAP